MLSAINFIIGQELFTINLAIGELKYFMPSESVILYGKPAFLAYLVHVIIGFLFLIIAIDSYLKFKR